MRCSHLDPLLANVLDKATKMELSRRYATAEEMYQDLHSLIISSGSKPVTPAETIQVTPSPSGNLGMGYPATLDKTVITRPVSSQTGSKSPSIFPKLAMAAFTLFVSLLGLGGGIVITQQIREAEQKAEQAERDKQEAQRKQQEAEAKIAAEAQKQKEIEQEKLEAERNRLAQEAAQISLERQNLINQNDNVSPIKIGSSQLSTSGAAQTVKELYFHLSDKNFDEAMRLYSPSMQYSFNSNFFNQFKKVTVENLEVVDDTSFGVSLVGSNTYYYYDGTTQRERRSYQVDLVNGQPKIVDSKFLKVTKMRR